MDMKQSGGILVYRRNHGSVEVLLMHPGGPFWSKKDVWSIPKGELDDDEDHETAAEREFEEELGVKPPAGKRLDLGTSKQRGKINHIWAVEGDFDVNELDLKSMFSMEWPPHFGEKQEFPENDRAEWFDIAIAKIKVFKNQAVFFDRLAEKFGVQVVEKRDDVPTEELNDQQTSLL
jgi:predicted NUDIX family NTP pyrophosphohydrolase